MDYREIKALLDKYLEGNTSLEEEKILRKFFDEKQDVPEDIQYAKHMFSSFRNEASGKPDFVIKDHKVIHFRKRNIFVLTGIAASILLIIGYFLINNSRNDQIIYAYFDGKPVHDKQFAINETKRALMLISSNLNQGTRDLNYLAKINEIEQLVIKNE